MRKEYCLYRHTSPNGKVYIGITSRNPKERFRNGRGYNHNRYFKRAIEAYGWENITHEILMQGLTREQAIKAEKELIFKHDSTNPKHGYNLMTGGDGTGTHTKRTREILRQLNLGKTWTEEQKERQRNAMLGHTLSEESKEKLRTKRLGVNNPFYGKKHTLETIKRIKESRADFNGGKSVNARKVAKYDTDGKLIAIYDAISTAAKENGIKSFYNITACCKGKQKTSGGFVWKYLR